MGRRILCQSLSSDEAILDQVNEFGNTGSWVKQVGRNLEDGSSESFLRGIYICNWLAADAASKLAGTIIEDLSCCCPALRVVSCHRTCKEEKHLHSDLRISYAF